MREKGDVSKKKSSPRSNLTLFGEWFYFAIDYLNVSRDEIVERTGLNESSLSRATRDYKEARTMKPSRVTIEKILGAFRAIADEKQMPWGKPLDMRIMHAAGYATDEDIQASREALDILRSRH
jgi:transcriptional regulator with XRE-family HTH domain